MSKYFETIRKYFRKGLYTAAHLAVLVDKGVISEQEHQAIEPGE